MTCLKLRNCLTGGVNRIALEGLVRRVITSHVGLEPAVARLVEENKVLAYMVPLELQAEGFAL